VRTCQKCGCDLHDSEDYCPACLSSVTSLLSAIDGNYAGMSKPDLVLTCNMLSGGRAKWRADAENYQAALSDLMDRLQSPTCLYAAPGRGDCEHFVGLPGLIVKGHHDGPPTEDEYGKPNGWCWYCWLSHKAHIATERLNAMKQDDSLNSVQEDIDNLRLDLADTCKEDRTLEIMTGIIAEIRLIKQRLNALEKP